MNVINPMSQADQITTAIDELSNKLYDLPLDTKEQIQAEFDKLKAAVRGVFSGSGAKFWELASSQADSVTLYDHNLRLVTWNEASAKTALAAKDQFIGKTFAEIYPDLIGGEIHQLYLRALETQLPQSQMIHWVRQADGCVFYFEHSVYPTNNGLVALQKDVTERIRSELVLLESEGRFRALADGTPVLIWVTNASGGIEFINKAYGDFFGVKIEDLQSGGWQMLVHPDDTTRYVDVFNDCMRERKPFRAQGRVLRSDGQWRWIESYGQPRFSDTGEYLGTAGSSLDITERKHAEEVLLESEAREHARASELEALMDAVPAIIWISRDPECRNMIGNEYGYQFLGMQSQDNLSKTAPEEALARQHYRNMKDGKPLPSSKLPMQIAAATGKPSRNYEFDLIFDDGRFYHLLGNVNPLFDPAGNPSGAIGAFVDITAIRKLQAQQIEAKATLEVQRRLMGQREQERQGIARDIHDGPIQTLSSTAFSIQILKEAYPDPTLQVELTQIVMSVKNAVQELRQVVNDLRPPSLIRFGLARAIQMHAEEMRERYPEIEIELDLAHNGAQLSDQTALTLFRVFQEGLNNVIRHADASRVWLRYEVDQDSFTLILQDNGLGFVVPNDFAELMSAGHYGLAGMKERVETVGGEFFVTSQPGEGTMIRIHGPLLGKNIK